MPFASVDSIFFGPPPDQPLFLFSVPLSFLPAFGSPTNVLLDCEGGASRHHTILSWTFSLQPTFFVAVLGFSFLFICAL